MLQVTSGPFLAMLARLCGLARMMFMLEPGLLFHGPLLACPTGSADTENPKFCYVDMHLIACNEVPRYTNHEAVTGADAGSTWFTQAQFTFSSPTP